MRCLTCIVPLVLVVIISRNPGVFGKLVPGLQTCSRNDPDLNECMVKKLGIAVRVLAKGVPSMGLLPFDPLHADEIVIDDTGSVRQVATNLRMKNINYIGLATGRVKSANIDLNASKLSWKAFTSSIKMVGQYDISGRILILPIVGKGNLNITLSDIATTMDISYKLESRKGKNYMVPTDIKYDFVPEKMSIHLDGLFNGDTRLESHMNEFLNENWRELMKDMGQPLTQVVGTFTKNYLTTLFSDTPYDTFFPA